MVRMIKLELHGNSKLDLWVPHLKHSRRVLRTLQSLQKRLKGGQHLRLAGRKSPVFGAVKEKLENLLIDEHILVSGWCIVRQQVV